MRCQRSGIMYGLIWQNKPAPLLNPGTLKPMTAEELGVVFCDELVQQELNDTDACDSTFLQEIR